MTESNTSSVICSNGRNLPTPALTKRTSTFPNLSFTAANSLSVSARLDASERIARTSPPISRLASSSVCWSRPVMTTRAPCSLNSFAVARPMPELPPVMTATLPSNLPMVFPLPFLICRWRFHKSARACATGLNVLEHSFQNNTKNLVEYRERDLHNILQRLAILRVLRHQHQSLDAAAEKSRDGARITNSFEFTILFSTQQGTIKSALNGCHVAASPGGGRLAATSQLRHRVTHEAATPLPVAERSF